MGKPEVPENCEGFNPAHVEAQNVGGSWKVGADNKWLLDFGANPNVSPPPQARAEMARDIIRHYDVRQMCFVGRPSQMMYFRAGNSVPTGPFPDEDCNFLDNTAVQAQYVNGSWKVVEPGHWILDFGDNEADA